MPCVIGVDEVEFIGDVVLHRDLVIMCHFTNLQTYMYAYILIGCKNIFVYAYNVYYSTYAQQAS